jgi:signal transduction histidine kinase
LVIAHLAFINGWWLPVIPNLIGIWLNSVLLGNGLYINKLKKTNLELESEVTKRTNKLIEMQEQMLIQEKTAYLGLLTAGLAHEIRNPLFLSKNFINLTQQEIATLRDIVYQIFEEPENEDNLTDFLNTHNNCSENINYTFNQIIAIENIIKNIIPLKNEPTLTQIDLNSLVRNCGNLIYKSFQSSEEWDNQLQILIDYRLEENLPTFSGNRTEIAQVIINLTENALHSVSERVKVRPNPPGLILFSTRSLKNQVEVSVIDNGTGIPSEIKNKLFEPFFTTKQTRKGLGLGLSLCQMIVSKHEGNISVNSSNNITEFKLTFPLS